MNLFYAILLVALTVTRPLSHAEYRAYELQVENTETGQSRKVLSTLDHLQYPRYHALSKNEVVTYVDSWMCYENMSSFRPVCTRPERKANSNDKL